MIAACNIDPKITNAKIKDNKCTDIRFLKTPLIKLHKNSPTNKILPKTISGLCKNQMPLYTITTAGLLI
jgi:hypothetical protein